jgi:glycosyl transferase family 7 (putative galactosyltransferase)
LHATSYIITYRATDDPARRANLDAVLDWLKLQTLADVIVIEQDVAPTLGDLASFPGLRTLFAYNPGPFNKSWGLNVGVRASKGSLLAFGDADVLCRGLPAAVAAARSGAPVVRAFSKALDLDEGDSDILRSDLSCLGDPSFGAAAPDRAESGEIVPLCGALVLFQRQFLARLGGWDERFLGWGGEDDAMDIKVQRSGARGVKIKGSPGFHLAHRGASGTIAADPHYRNNLALLQQLRAMPDDALRRMCEVTAQLAGNQDMHRPMEKLA